MTVQPDATDEPIEVRRNAGLLALVALGSFAMAVAYGWRAAGDSAAILWLIVGALAVIGVLHLVAWFDARAPLLVADTHGVRMRVGREWRGLPWVAIDRVELEPRRNVLRDGRIVVVPDSDEEPLSLPMGLATAARADEVVRRLTGLAKDRTDVSVRVSRPVPATDEPTPGETSTWETSAAEYAATRDEFDSTDTAADPLFNPADSVTTPGSAGPLPAAEPETPQPTTVPAIQGAGRAVRAEVTRSGPSSIGMLALKQDPADLPEARELRGTNGRVGLVIEATPVVESDAEVADPVPGSAQTGVEPELADDEDDDAAEAAPAIGASLREARERLQLSVDALAERTRIRPHVIEAIEADDFAPCGGDFYARGHLRSLARILGVEDDELIATYDDTYAQAPIEARKVFEAELATGPRPSIRLTTGGPNWAALIAVVLVLGIVWGAVQYFAGSDEADGGSQT
ncbi:MAG TPA: helix-turn-helix domain-containing protein, partial [Nocardioidaceae bacterium]|nr:helix-turn-helix domain-containing protein [Nocardioidaceae bacterium]